jgi:hypothetical protein
MAIKYRKHELHPESILIRDFNGEVSTNEIIESWEYLISENLINDSTKGVINNISGCALLMDMEGFKVVLNYMKQQDILKKVKLAVICDDPKTIVFPALGERTENELRIKPFSTMNAAVNWVLD